MKIAQVAPLIEPVPPKLYGGTERVVSYLTEELVRRGHEVVLFASGDSHTHAKLLSPIANAIRLNGAWNDPNAFHVIELTDVLAQADEFDIIHCHLDYLAFPFSRFFGTPSVHTLHSRLDYPYSIPIMQRYRDVALVSISTSQRRPLQGLDLRWADTIYHGLPDRCFQLYPGEGDYLAYYSRLSHEKRPDLAIEVAKRAGVPLKMAGKVGEEDIDFFQGTLRPMLDHPLVDFIGEIGEDERPAFLGNARALIFPVEWPEPFGLVMIESMATGTPVISRPYGAVPEVIDQGITGIVSDTVEGMADAVGRARLISREGCLERARERFSSVRMTDQYERVYSAVCCQEI